MPATPRDSAVAVPTNGAAEPRWIAFEGARCIASGRPAEVALRVKMAMARAPREPVVVLDEATSEVMEFDLRGTEAEVVERLATRSDPSKESATVEPPGKRGPGRPRLGVVAREVTLLPRHWAWLSEQPGGASVVLRRLVEEAKRASPAKDRARKAQEAVYRFMSVMAGNLPGFEEALRAFYAGNEARVNECIGSWPTDVREHLGRLLAASRLARG